MKAFTKPSFRSVHGQSKTGKAPAQTKQIGGKKRKGHSAKLAGGHDACTKSGGCACQSSQVAVGPGNKIKKSEH